jgi:internalin A
MTNQARRRRLTLSVRALMVLVLILGGGIGWVVNRANARRRPVAVIREKAGAIGAAYLTFDYQYANGQFDRTATSRVPSWLRKALGDEFFHDVVSLNVDFSKLAERDADDVMAAIRQLPRLRRAFLDNPPEGASIRGLDHLEGLTLDYNAKGAAGPVDLGTLPKLQKLILTGPGANDAALAQLPKQPALVYVFVVGPDVTDAGLKHLGGMTALHILGITSPKVTDAGLKSLMGLKDLRLFTISSPKVTGPGLECLEGMKGLDTLTITCPNVTEAGLAHLAGLTELETLRLAGRGRTTGPAVTPVTDAALEPLGRLTRLGELDLSGCTGVTDRGATLLARNHPRLQTLRLTGTGITDAGLAHLAGLDELRLLQLDGTKITDAGLAHLRGRLPNLKALLLHGTAVTDAGLAHLRGMRLRSLNLQETAVTDAGLEHLGGQTELVTLGLTKTRVTDAGLIHLRGMKKLQSLLVLKTAVSSDGIAGLQAAIPSLKQVRGGTIKPAGAPIVEP